MRPQWRLSVVVPAAAVAAAACAAFGLLASRPDVVVLGIAPALWAVWAYRRPVLEPQPLLRHSTRAAVGATETTVHAAGDGHGTAEVVQVAVELPDGRMHDVVLPAAGGQFTVRTRVLHSGPATVARLTPRLLTSDGAVVGDASHRVDVEWATAPASRALGGLPLPRRLTGMHGAHDAVKPGRGGDFRDIHPFAPGDEVRRIDWRATARLARRPDDLYVRRTLSVSDASVVVVVDTTADLGESVASWGSTDVERSGVTSLDLAREAARSIAETAVSAGDRVALHELAVGGRTVRSGAGPRHLARIVAALSVTGERDGTIDPARLPPVPGDALVCVLSTFFDGAAAHAALVWRAAGHRVLAVDTLPETDGERLSREQRVAARIVFSERDEVFRDLAGGGIDVVRWSDGPGVDTALRLAMRSRR